MKKLRVLLLVCAIALVAGALAGCNKKRYTVTFDTRGGNEISSLSLKEGAEIERPEDPVKELFLFDTWYGDESLTVPFDFTMKMPANDITVYAGWYSTTSVRVLYDSMGGSAVAPSVGAAGASFSLPEDPVREGYSFAGWYSDPACKELFTSAVFPSENTTLYARWTNDPAYVYFDYYGNGVRIAHVPVKKGETTVSPALFGDDIEYSGWFTDAACTAPFRFGGAAEGSNTLYTVYYTKGLSFEGGAVTGYTGSSSSVILPTSHEGTLVSSVGARAFIQNTNIRTVDVTESVTSIGAGAFYGCRYLESVDLSRRVTSIGQSAFFACERLINYGDLSGVTAIPDGLFLGCKKLPEIELSERVSHIGAQAFADCETLRSFVVPSFVTAIGDGTFDGCKSLASVTLPSGLQTLGQRVFNGCSSLYEIVFSPDENSDFALHDGNLYSNSELVRYVGGSKQETSFRLPDFAVKVRAGAFEGSDLTEIEVRNQGVVLDCGAFEGMEHLVSLSVPSLGGNGTLAYLFGAEGPEETGRTKSAYIPETLRSFRVTGNSWTNIADYAFYGANGLSSVEGYSGAASVGDYAFGYTAITKFTVYPALERLSNFAFEGCKQLSSFEMTEPSSRYAVEGGCLYNSDLTELLSVPKTMTNVTFSQNIRSIASYAFTDSEIEEIVIPDTVENIGSGAFNGMRALRSLEVPFYGGEGFGGGSTYFGTLFGATATITDEHDTYGVAHKGLTIYNGANIPVTLSRIVVKGEPWTKVADATFAFFRGLDELVLPEGSNVTGYGAFSFYNTMFRTVDLAGVTEVGDYAFSYSALREVHIPSTLKIVNYASFGYLSDLESIVIDEGVQELKSRAFIATGVSDTSAPHGVFFSSKVRSEVVIPSTMTAIGPDAFSGVGTDNSSTDWVQSESFSVRFHTVDGVTALTTIDDGAFAYAGLKTIEIPSSVTKIGDQAFQYCDWLEEITVGARGDESDITDFGVLCFSGNANLQTVTLHITSFFEMPLSPYTDNAGVRYLDIFYSSSRTLSIFVPEDLVQTFVSASYWRSYTGRIFAIGGEA